MSRSIHAPLLAVPLLAAVVSSVSLGAEPAVALQGLMPAPYPSAPPGGSPITPAPPDGVGGQTIMKTPYPQTIGHRSQGNPPQMGRHAHQTLVPSTNQRKYGVDEAPR